MLTFSNYRYLMTVIIVWRGRGCYIEGEESHIITRWAWNVFGACVFIGFYRMAKLLYTFLMLLDFFILYFFVYMLTFEGNILFCDLHSALKGDWILTIQLRNSRFGIFSWVFLSVRWHFRNLEWVKYEWLGVKSGYL